MSHRLVMLLASPDGRRGDETPRPFSVVVVDDTEDLRFILRRVLSSTGRFTIAGEADNGKDGVEVIRRAQPDLVVLDLLMPVMDGWEALPHIQQASPRSRIVVLSGQDRLHMEARALKMGASAYIEKGAPSAEIVRTLTRVMEH